MKKRPGDRFLQKLGREIVLNARAQERIDMDRDRENWEERERYRATLKSCFVEFCPHIFFAWFLILIVIGGIILINMTRCKIQEMKVEDTHARNVFVAGILCIFISGAILIITLLTWMWAKVTQSVSSRTRWRQRRGRLHYYYE